MTLKKSDALVQTSRKSVLEKMEPLEGIEPSTYALPRRRYLAVRFAHYR